MAKKFYPKAFQIVAATREDIPFQVEYKVSYGTEEWFDGKFRDVYKVQMVYDGKVNGRQAPSYPSGTDDFERVAAAMAQLRKEHG